MGGAGLAFPAGMANLIKATTFLAIYFLCHRFGNMLAGDRTLGIRTHLGLSIESTEEFGRFGVWVTGKLESIQMSSSICHKYPVRAFDSNPGKTRLKRGRIDRLKKCDRFSSSTVKIFPWRQAKGFRLSCLRARVLRARFLACLPVFDRNTSSTQTQYFVGGWWEGVAKTH